MRNVFCQTLVAAAQRPEFVFLTGDLGFQALEPLREALGKRFINAGVAEQNMVTVAAGLARSGLRPWVYSIAPFVYARPFEQIRNDLCLHRLPTVLVGNGGGYGYGVMGATHHAIEDYGTLLGLPHLKAFVPAFDEDVPEIANRLFQADHPCYLRLGLSERPADLEAPAYTAWRRLLTGDGWVIVVIGPLAGGIWDAVRHLQVPKRPTLWLLSELPVAEFPHAFLQDLARSERLLVLEEHVEQGGASQMIATGLLKQGLAPERFALKTAQGYVSGRYGSQTFHRRESELDPAAVVAFLEQEAC